jgi:hypothetical protein
MITKKILVFASIMMASIYYFIMYFGSYGPSLGNTVLNANSFLALGSAMIMIFVYITTKWRIDLKGSPVSFLFDMTILWVFICYFRCFLNVYRPYSLKEQLLSPYVGLSLFVILFFLVGVNRRYFYFINRILYIYCLVVFVISLGFMKYFELQFFLLMPLFYLIVTFPLQSGRDRMLTFIMAAIVAFTSLTNRAGVLRISISYLIIIGYYLVLKARINKKIIDVIVFCVLMVPFYLLYLGATGQDVFKILLGENTEAGYKQENLRADTRTFLYVDVFRDLKITKAWVFGKGTNAGYASDDFETFNRMVVEVGFLQILLKSGIVGFLLYMSLIITAIFKALNTSKNFFIKYCGVLLSGYVLMFFIENMIGFTLLNIIIWIVVGMCHSKELRGLSDKEIKELYNGAAVEES